MTYFTHTLTIRADNGTVVGEASGTTEVIISLCRPTALTESIRLSHAIYDLELSESKTFPALGGYTLQVTRMAHTAAEMSAVGATEEKSNG